ncbi:MAG: DNA polymerase III subunit delta [Candidatus Malacoplasma girerdii]|nr:MAG: DNA polymerase III subunit delta [Candidatus Malacoplasma girerdii]
MIVVYGLSENNINNTLFNLIFDLKITQTFDFKKDLTSILNELNQVSIFDEEANDEVKNYVITNAKFLTDKKDWSDQLDQLINTSHNLICTVSARNLSSFKLTKEQTKKIKFVKANAFSNEDKEKFVNKLIKKYQLNFTDEQTINYLIEKLANNPFTINNELNKFHLCNGTEIITKKIVDSLCFNSNEANIMVLGELIIKNDVKNAYRLYNWLLSQKELPITIIILLGYNFLEFKFQKMFLMKYGTNSTYSLAMKFGWYPKTLMNNLTFLQSVSLQEINNFLKDLYQLEIDIKLSKVIPETALGLLILKKITSLN